MTTDGTTQDHVLVNVYSQKLHTGNYQRIQPGRLDNHPNHWNAMEQFVILMFMTSAVASDNFILVKSTEWIKIRCHWTIQMTQEVIK